MDIIDNNLWRTYINEQLQSHNNVYATCTMLGALIFKSTRPPMNSIALWNDDIVHFKSAFSKASPEKQEELARHTVIKLPFTFDRKVSVAEILRLFDTSGGVSHILGFLSCNSQGFPVYNNVPVHIQIVENYVKCMFQNVLKSHFSKHVHIINGTCYASVSLLTAMEFDTTTCLKYINDSNIIELHTKDISADTWDICILEREENDWCTFALNARRSILKDFAMHPNCICSSIHTVSGTQLNRASVLSDQPTHLVTVFDLPSVLSSFTYSLCEHDTINIFESLLV